MLFMSSMYFLNFSVDFCSICFRNLPVSFTNFSCMRSLLFLSFITFEDVARYLCKSKKCVGIGDNSGAADDDNDCDDDDQ